MGFFDIFKSKPLEQEREVEQKIESDFSHFEEVTEYLYTRSGITDLGSRRVSISKLKSFSKEENIHTTEEFLSKLQRDSNFYQEVLNIVTVNETYFLREVKELEWLVSLVKESSRDFKILSLPCSSGEEVYSILILLSEQDIDLSRVEIVGYDLNSKMLEDAKKAHYSERSVSNLTPTQKQKYFMQNGDGTYEVVPQLKVRARFEQNNIFELQKKNEFDILLSRNMFIYFDEAKRDKATDIIVNLLKEGGYFIKGHADTIYNHPKLEGVRYGVYRRV